MRIVCLSDTHGGHRLVTVPDGDLLVFAGDLSRRGKLDEVEDFDRWLGGLPHRHKVVVAGNHDFAFQEQPAAARRRLTNAVYLEDDGVTVGGVRVWGSPWQPWFGGWAFNLARGPEIAARWALIPENTEILITHGPPEGILDVNSGGQVCGCRDLLDRVLAVRPRLHVFGHIHESRGRADCDGTVYVNAAVPFGEGVAQVVELG